MDVIMPQLGETVSEGTVSAWHRKVGDTVSVKEALFDVSSDKAEMEVPAPADGVLAEIRIAEGETVPVGEVVAVIESQGEAKEGPPPQAGRGDPLSPAVRRLLEKHGLDAASIAGTGAGGRIKKKDVLARLAASAPGTGDVEIIPFDNLRKRTAEHMVRSKATSPHVLQAVEADFRRVALARAERGEEWAAREGFSLTWLPFVARAVCTAIGDYPRVNGFIEGGALAVHRRVHLAVAVDLDFGGLVAPVVRDAQDLSVTALARAIRDVATRARSRQLAAAEFSGGTYTISNSGIFGTLITAPVINQPQVAILSTDGVSRKPVVVENDGSEAIGIRPIGVLAQSFDHRAFDGAYSAAFLARLRETIETTDWMAALDEP